MNNPLQVLLRTVCKEQEVTQVVDKAVWDIQDIMRHFGKSHTTVWHWRKKGYLPKPTYQMGQRPYWDAIELVEFLKGRVGDEHGSKQSSSPCGR